MKPYPHAIETLAELRRRQKRILLLSNAPKRAFRVRERLEELGFTDDLYDYLLTSGEATYQHLEAQQSVENRYYRYYYIGPDRDDGILEGLDYKRTRKPDAADFALCIGFDFHETLEDRLPETDDCLAAGLPMICANPDKIIIRQNGDRNLCAGVIADYYKENGGEVTYFGKPYADIYRQALDFLDATPSQVAAIGDNLHTDIAGANNMGMFSILVAGGILSERLGISEHNLQLDTQKLKEILDQEGIVPDITIPAFAW